MNYSFSSLTKYLSGKNNSHPDSSPNSGLEIAIADGISTEKHPNHMSNLLRGMRGYVAKVGLTVALTGYLLAGSACGSQAPPASTQGPNLQATVEALQSENRNLRRELTGLKESASTPVPTLESTLIATPIPENKRIYGIDEHHGLVVYSGITYIKGKGWKIIGLDVEPLTNGYLQQQGITILHIQHVELPYTEEEIVEIKKFVERGGGLLLQAGNPKCGEYSKEITKEFGVRILNDYFKKDLTIPVSSDHLLMKDVNSIFLNGGEVGCEYHGPPTYLSVNPPALPILSAGITEPYRPVMAAVEYGKGRVVIYPTAFALTLGKADNSNFLRNALYWLQQEKLP